MKKYLFISVLINIILLISMFLLFNNQASKTPEIALNKSAAVLKTDKNVINTDKSDPVYIYKSRKFPCDENSGSGLGYGLCTRERLEFADSLLAVVVKRNIEDYDIAIKRDKEGILKAKENSYFVKDLKINTASKENFIKWQQVWEEMRKLKSGNVRLGCDGGSGCVGITNDAEIKFILERIEEIKIKK